MIITNATLANPAEPAEFRREAGLVIRGGVIERIAESWEIEEARLDEDEIDAHGGLVIPGLVCAHTHFYGAFARGMALPGEPPANFVQILERLWWRLDKLLRPEDVEFSALAMLCDSVRHGTTTVIDHHASPNAIDGSLDIVAYACQQAGVRACLSYELSDRDGPASFAAGLAENRRFAKRVAKEAGADPGMLAASMGLHGSFTLSDASLCEAAGSARDLDIGCHVHVAEDLADARDSMQRYSQSVVKRLADVGALGAKSIAAHCVHVDDHDIEALRLAGAWPVHNPRSNMNNAVGAAPVGSFLDARVPLGLGNDGFTMNMFQEMKAAYLLHKHASGDPRALPADVLARMLWANNPTLACRLLGVERLGSLTEGAPADLVILDYQAPTPVTAGNLPWHIAFGVDGEHVRTTIAAGRALMRDRELLILDEERIHGRSRELAADLWRRAAAA